MVSVTRLNGKSYIINSDLVEIIESTPDTVITLITGKKIIVSESIDEVVDKIVEYRKKVNFLPDLNFMNQ